jgi:hypothetical protein
LGSYARVKAGVGRIPFASNLGSAKTVQCSRSKFGQQHAVWLFKRDHGNWLN